MHTGIPEHYRNQIVTGDARTLARALPDDSIDLLLHDPPFGINYSYSSGYKDDPLKYHGLIEWTIYESNRILRPGGLCFIFIASPRLRDTLPLFPEGTRLFAACKNFVQLRPTPVQFSYDPVLFWQKPGEYGKPWDGRDWHVANTCPRPSPDYTAGAFVGCPRPIETILYMVYCFCPEGGTVADFFIGSGTTAAAAKMAGRNWIGFEIMAETAELARERVKRTAAPLPLSPINMEQPTLKGLHR